MNPSIVRRFVRMVPIFFVLVFASVVSAQEILPMSVVPNVVPGGGSKHKLFLTLGNRNIIGMDTLKIKVVTASGEANFATLETLNPSQWQTLSGDIADDDGVVVVEYVANDKPQKVSVRLGQPTAAVGAPGPISSTRGMPSAAWLAGAALLGAIVTLAGATIGRRGR
ncbi:MAG: hypothetical protein HYX28_06765 [Candidatus Koribacter versatilis]|uniref:Uncharacterized protein n=1 Tax=Candidatus Korobacter versatilis TaxID=658062 RepID=A0A932A9D6_9BACT|nr:hypothetical protein [Candidatus Koribacter versatilis]